MGILDWTLSWRRRTFRLQLRTNRYYRYISCCLFSGCVRQGNIVHLNTLALSTALASVSLVGPDCLLLLFSSSSSSSSSSSREYHYHRCSWWRDSPRPSLPFSSCSCVCSNNKTQRARWRECGQISLLELSTRYFASKSKRKHVTPFLSDIKKKTQSFFTFKSAGRHAFARALISRLSFDRTFRERTDEERRTDRQVKESRLLFYHHSKRRQIEIREDGGKRESKMRYSQTHSPESQSLILNNKYTSWSAYFGVDAFLNAVWHNVFSMSVLASLLFLSVTIGAMSLLHQHISTRNTPGQLKTRLHRRRRRRRRTNFSRRSSL